MDEESKAICCSLGIVIVAGLIAMVMIIMGYHRFAPRWSIASLALLYVTIRYYPGIRQTLFKWFKVPPSE